MTQIRSHTGLLCFALSYFVLGRKSREAWERAERWYLGDVPGVLKR